MKRLVPFLAISIAVHLVALFSLFHGVRIPKPARLWTAEVLLSALPQPESERLQPANVPAAPKSPAAPQDRPRPRAKPKTEAPPEPRALPAPTEAVGVVGRAPVGVHPAVVAHAPPAADPAPPQPLPADQSRDAHGEGEGVEGQEQPPEHEQRDQQHDHHGDHLPPEKSISAPSATYPDAYAYARHRQVPLDLPPGTVGRCLRPAADGRPPSRARRSSTPPSSS